MHNLRSRAFIVIAGGLGIALSGASWAQSTSPATTAYPAAGKAMSKDARDEAHGAARDVQSATQVIQRMEARSDLADLLQHAKGAFVVPRFGRAALGIGGQGGVGLLLAHNGATWSNPAFYNFGGITAGVQAGVEGGAMVLVLNTDNALNRFLQNNDWSLDANAGLTVANWSKEGQTNIGKGDVTLWSDAKGLYGALNVGIMDIKYDADQTSAYYGQRVAARDVVQSRATLHGTTQLDALKQALASAGSTAASGTQASSQPATGTASASPGNTTAMSSSSGGPGRPSRSSGAYSGTK